MIRYLKSLFSKKETPILHQKVSEQDNFIHSIKEMNVSNNIKIDLLIRRKFSLTDDKILDSSSFTVDFGCDYDDLDKLNSEIEYVFNIKIQKKGFDLTVKGIKEYVEKKINIPEFVVPDEDLYSWPESIEEILYREHLFGRSEAIKQLVDNNYQILDKESKNPFKELINYTLQHFKQYFKNKPAESENLLRSAFPIMHQFILRQISQQQYIISTEAKFDEQKAYDEFLVFCTNILCALYPDKKERDRQIRKHFKVTYNGILNHIENYQYKQQ